MKICFMLIALFLLTLLQVLLGNLSLAVPLAFMGAVYFTVAYGWRQGAFATFLAGSVTAVLCGTAGMVPAAFLSVPAAVWWHRHHEEDSLLIGWQCGVFPVLGEFLCVQAGRLATGGVWPHTVTEWLLGGLQLGSSLVLAAVLFPAVVFLGELAAEWFGLPRFRPVGALGRTR